MSDTVTERKKRYNGEGAQAVRGLRSTMIRGRLLLLRAKRMRGGLLRRPAEFVVAFFLVSADVAVGRRGR